MDNFHDEAIFGTESEYGADASLREEQPQWALSYFQCLSAIDENIGRLLDALEEAGLAENTVVIFSSDNGYYFGEHGLGDYQGDKRSAYEGSHAHSDVGAFSQSNRRGLDFGRAGIKH